MIENTDDLPSLPDSWTWTRLGEIGIVASGGTPSTSVPEYFDGDVPWITPADLSNFTAKFIQRGRRSISEKGLNSSSAVLLPAGTVLFSSRAPIGYVAIAANPIATNQGFKNLILCEGTFNEYVFHYLKASKRLAESYGSGTTFREVSASRFALIPIPLAPLNEQVRVVARLEELFARLDAGVEELRKVKAQLKRYRQAVLKNAFEGKLTEEWRKTHRDQIEPAIKLLERIREVRKDTKFKELPSIDTVDLPILPEEWTWARIGEIAESMRNGVYKPKESYGNDGVACLRMYNIENGAIIWQDIKRMNLTPEEIEFYELKPGDILVNRVNSRELVGKAAVISVGLERCVYESKNIRLRLLPDYANSKYVSFWFLMYSQKFFSRNAQQTVGMASINQEQLASMPIPLCHPNEQTKAVEEVERLFSIADEVGKIATESIEQTDKMRQSILKMAFEGKIVPQDPSDEPASKLLERIGEEKAKSKGGKDVERRLKNKPKQLELSTYVK